MMGSLSWDRVAKDPGARVTPPGTGKVLAWDKVGTTFPCLWLGSWRTQMKPKKAVWGVDTECRSTAIYTWNQQRGLIPIKRHPQSWREVRANRKKKFTWQVQSVAGTAPDTGTIIQGGTADKCCQCCSEVENWGRHKLIYEFPNN